MDKIKLSAIKVTERNPRKISDEKLKELQNSISSFTEMMEMRPLVVDEDFNLLGGNQRIEALKGLGYKDIPRQWVIQKTGLSAEQKREFIIRDNTHYGEWDWAILQEDWDIDMLGNFGLDMPGLDIDSDDFGTEFKLPNGDKNPFQQITFSLADKQAEVIQKGISQMKEAMKTNEFDNYGNLNSNGNAIYLIVKKWLDSL